MRFSWICPAPRSVPAARIGISSRVFRTADTRQYDNQAADLGLRPVPGFKRRHEHRKFSVRFGSRSEYGYWPQAQRGLLTGTPDVSRQRPRLAPLGRGMRMTARGPARFDGPRSAS